MYAVIETGGRQYRVQQGDVIDVERLADAPAGDSKKKSVRFDRVLLVASDGKVKVGSPTVAGAKVTGVLLGDVRGAKVVVFKKKRRKGYKRRNGHRQDLHRVRIEKIEG